MKVPPPLTRATVEDVTAEVSTSSALSLLAHPGDGRIRSRQVAVLAHDGVDGASLTQIATRLDAEGAVCKVVSVRLGMLDATTGASIPVEATFENAPSVLFDGVIIADGAASVEGLLLDGRTREFLRDAYRHGKTILALGEGSELLVACGVPTRLPNEAPDPGLLVEDAGELAHALDGFVAALGRHRHPERDTDPPRV
jgi:catalase